MALFCVSILNAFMPCMVMLNMLCVVMLSVVAPLNTKRGLIVFLPMFVIPECKQKMTSLRGQASLAKMTSFGGKGLFTCPISEHNFTIS
jgi:hypothetical protein